LKSNATYLNISERRFFLITIDSLVILFTLYISFKVFDFNFFDFLNTSVFGWLFLLIVYFILFGEIFQLYNLSVSNNRYLVFRSIIVTTFTTIIFYIFTPFITPELPPNRLKIVYLFLIIAIPVLLWRFIYIQFIFSPKYFKNIVFIGESSKIKSLIKKTHNNSFHNLVYYFSTDE
jgi:FlaA1/EpsC-like NDP-sugar epimerase